MAVTRRMFIKAGSGAIVASTLGFDLRPAYAQARELKIARTTETASTCPYCSVSCGVIIHTIGDKAKNVTPQVVHVEGDPDHPINRGTLCPKGIVAASGHPERTPAAEAAGAAPGFRPLGRHPWDQAIDEIGAPHQEDARRNVRRRPTRRAAPSIAARASPGTAAARIPTSSITSSSKRCAAWGSATWKTRPGFDTVQRSPVWGPRLDAVR